MPRQAPATQWRPTVARDPEQWPDDPPPGRSNDGSVPAKVAQVQLTMYDSDARALIRWLEAQDRLPHLPAQMLVELRRCLGDQPSEEPTD